MSLSLGAWLGGKTGHSPTLFLVAALVLAGLAVVAHRRTGAHLALLLSWVSTGIGLSTFEARTLVPTGLEGAPARIEATVEDVTPFPDSTRLTLAVSRAAEQPARFQATVYARGPLEVTEGQRIVAPARLKSFDPPANPGQADLRESQRRSGLRFTGSIEGDAIVPASPAAPWRLWVGAQQRALAARVRDLAPSKEAGSLYLTLAAGLRAEMGQELEDQFAASGLAHVLSISGLHVAALALMVLKLLRMLLTGVARFDRRFEPRRVAAILAAPIVWAYVAYTGMQPPAVRSAVMATVMFGGMALWRRPDALNSLSLAAIALLVIDPASIADLSLQLSFLAVLSLIVLSPAVRAAIPIPKPDPSLRNPWRRRLQDWREEAVGTFAASVAVTVTGIPLIAATFHRFSLAGLVSNIVCLPLCGVLTALAAGGGAAFMVSPTLATPILWAGTWASQLLVWAVRFFAALPAASLPAPSLGSVGAALFLGGLGVFALGRGRWRWLALAAPIGLAGSWALPVALPQPGLRVAFLSVGHGDAIVLSSAGHHALIDGGGVPGGTDTGRKFVVPYLRERRVGRFDLAVLSHPHPDHALGLASTLRVVPTRRLWIPAHAFRGELTRAVIDAARAPVEEVGVGHPPLQLGEATLEVLGPPADDPGFDVNDGSVVLRVTHRAVSFLFTGDIEAEAEATLSAGPVTVLKAPHHGSRTSSTPDFVARVHPRFVVFCVGRNNRFHFPAAEVESRYRAIGTHCFRTDLDGAVEMESDGTEVHVRPFLQRPDDPLLAPARGDEQGWESR